MSYVVRRRDGDQTAESDRLEGHLAAAWNEAIGHLRSLDRKATDFTVIWRPRSATTSSCVTASRDYSEQKNSWT
jgi:hypothetical protein